MSRLRRVKRLNRLLLAELGPNPLREWVHTRDGRLTHPMHVFEINAQGKDEPVYDYYCGCGKNRSIHTPDCKELTRPVPRYEVRPVLDLARYPDNWCLAAQINEDRSWWEHNFPGFPYRPAWYPVENQAVQLVLGRGLVPTEDDTWEVIKMIRESRQLTEDLETAYDEHELAKAREKQSKLDAALRDAVSVSSRPGAKEEVSFPSAMRFYGRLAQAQQPQQSQQSR